MPWFPDLQNAQWLSAKHPGSDPSLPFFEGILTRDPQHWPRRFAGDPRLADGGVLAVAIATEFSDDGTLREMRIYYAEHHA